ncbi:hypothetical protein [Levilactobacillus phage ENFP1]|nr:hypothetical protein [Levilactobacillus phage ENFP1]
MKFYEVLKSVMEGNKAYRKGWNGKNMFIYLERGSVIPKSKVNNDTLRFSLTDKEVTINPHIDLKNSKGELQVGWSPSQEDLLADDWQDFYFQDKNKPIDTIHGGIVVPTSREEMYNRVLETIQDLFEQSKNLEVDANSIGLPLNTGLLVKNISWSSGTMIAITSSIEEDDISYWTELKGYTITVDNIVEFIYNHASNIGTLYYYKEFINSPERVLYEVITDLKPTIVK